METTIVQLSPVGLALVPIVIALVAVAKIYINSYWAPLMSLAFGAALSYWVGGVTVYDSTLLGGLVVGVMAAGVYSGAMKMWNDAGKTV